MVPSPACRPILVGMTLWCLVPCGNAADVAHAPGTGPAPLPAPALPPELMEDPLRTPLGGPGGLSTWLVPAGPRADEETPPAIETVARPLEEFVKTPWKAPAFAAPVRPGFLVRQERRLPFGFDAEWRVGVAVDSQGPGRGAVTDATQWTIRKALADDFVVYLHDRGTGFMKSFGEKLSVFGRYYSTGDRTNPVETLQIGAAKSY